MAVPSNTVQTDSRKGLREDLHDKIFQISPVETPICMTIGTGKAKNVLHEWQVDSLTTAASNAHIEGDDADADSRAATSRVGNQLQILKKVVGVSGTSEAVDSAGRRSEFAYQLAQASKELKRDLEFTVSQNAAAHSGGSATARTMAGMETWIANNKSQGDGTTPGITSGTPSTAPTDGTTVRAVTEQMLKDVVKLCWDEGGEPSIVSVGGFNKQAMSAFSGIATLYRDSQKLAPAQIIASADIYVSDFGQLSIVANRFQRDRTALVYDPKMWDLAFLRRFKREKLAKTGDSMKSHIVGEVTLACRNEKASGKIADLTTA